MILRNTRCVNTGNECTNGVSSTMKRLGMELQACRENLTVYKDTVDRIRLTSSHDEIWEFWSSIGVMKSKAKVACPGRPTEVRTVEIRWVEEGLELVYGC